MFNHIPCNLPDIKTEDRAGDRYYLTPDGAFPSITTVLSYCDENDGLTKWKDAVGEEYARKFTSNRARFGTKLHNVCEAYLKNDEPPTGMMPNLMQALNGLKPYLNKIDNIRGIEQALYSPYLKVAGRTDIIADYDSTRAIIDLKGSNTATEFVPEKIEKYFIQLTGYAQMFEERTGLVINHGVLLIATEFGPEVHVKPLKPYWEPLLKIVDKFYDDGHYKQTA